MLTELFSLIQIYSEWKFKLRTIIERAWATKSRLSTLEKLNRIVYIVALNVSDLHNGKIEVNTQHTCYRLLVRVALAAGDTETLIEFLNAFSSLNFLTFGDSLWNCSSPVK